MTLLTCYYRWRVLLLSPFSLVPLSVRASSMMGFGYCAEEIFHKLQELYGVSGSSNEDNKWNGILSAVSYLSDHGDVGGLDWKAKGLWREVIDIGGTIGGMCDAGGRGHQIRNAQLDANHMRSFCGSLLRYMDGTKKPKAPSSKPSVTTPKEPTATPKGPPATSPPAASPVVAGPKSKAGGNTCLIVIIVVVGVIVVLAIVVFAIFCCRRSAEDTPSD